LIEAGTPGVRVGQPYDKIGLRGSPTADVYLDACQVPLENRLGAEGSGAALFTDSMNWERTCLFAAFLGAMQCQLDRTVSYARERSQFGAPIGTFQAVSHKLVEMRMRVDTARLLLYRAAWGLERDPLDTVAPAMAKIAVSEGAVQVGLDAIQVHGGLGVLTGPIERLLRDALPSRIFSGTSEIQRNNIARAMGLGEALRPRKQKRITP
jgi:alkylation response protein AidB-like acyl-CoA dehydrogenase